MLRLSNVHVSLTIEPARGAQIVELSRAGDDVNALAFETWDSPPAADGVSSYYDPELDWLSGYHGGWQETLPNAGQASHLDGMPLPFHGEGSFIPWQVVESGPDHCVVATHLRPTLSATRSMTLSATHPAVQVATRVTNTGLLPVPMVWGHHPAFAADAGTVLHLPATRYSVDPAQPDGLDTTEGTWPTSSAPDGPVDLSRFSAATGQRLVYCHGHDEGWAVVEQNGLLPHAALSWDVAAYPATWIWQNRAATGFPWFGRLRCLAVEPQRAWPFDGLAGARSRGQELTVAPGRSVESWITVALPEQLPAVITGVDQDGHVMGDRP
ncbi:galactose mutarotase-like enzyme [Geodermatophilus daqingensis]|uniref:Galactose mutarotase-like enzyme n=2 Tax=Petropleomorpha daqingensis TaxID=2026353 RepID=A0A853CJY1_9ACTN|nr:galactose mutarotase-like enzyme [Petropleomorpha daqingensis]